MIIKVLGTGCSKCKKLEENVKEAIKETGITATVEKVEKLKDIAKFGVMMTPTLVIDEEVKVVGKVSTVEEIKALIK